jgi:hypothetical protein
VTSDRVQHEVLDPAAAGALEPGNRRRIVTWLVLTVALVAAAAVLFLVLDARGRDRERALNESVTALAQQVRQLGGTPVVQPPGIPGPEGQSGRDGTNGRDGRDGVTPPCVSEPPQCRGADGEPGEPGEAGPSGQGGQNGQDGTPGKDGTDGVDGQPPASWSWVDGDGRTQSCTRNAGTPDTAPTYTCTAPSSGPPGTTTTTPPPLPGLR